MVFDGNGKYVNFIGGNGSAPGQMNLPTGVALDQQGRLVIADKGNQRVDVFTTDGKFVTVKGAGNFVEPSYLAVAPDGAIYVTDAKAHHIVVLR
jgi:DNA-binding beta-propeller fold protein YncE